MTIFQYDVTFAYKKKGVQTDLDTLPFYISN